MDEVHMQLKLNPTDPLYQSKIDELKDSWRTQINFKAVANLQNKQTSKMIAFARYIVLSNQDADVYLEWQKSQSELKMKQAAR